MVDQIELRFQVQAKIKKPVADVFEAVHCGGWMQMLCCLKVFVDGRNIREFLI